jgi:tight adherence protein C
MATSIARTAAILGVLLPILGIGRAASRARRRHLPPRGLNSGIHPTPPPGRPWAAGRLARAARRLPGWADRRQRELEEAVPEALDVLRATIAAGVAPVRALQATAEAAPRPLAPMLATAVRATQLGSGAGRALADVGREERLSELVLAGEALDLAEATGAPAGQVLAGVTAAATDRVRGQQARLAATAEARLSARVVAAMAPGFLAVLTLTAPADAAFLIRSPAGWATLAAAAAFESVGVWWSSRIVTGSSAAPARPPRRPELRDATHRSADPAPPRRTTMTAPSGPPLMGPRASARSAGSKGRLNPARGRLHRSSGRAARSGPPGSRRAHRGGGPVLVGGVVLAGGLGFVAGPALLLAASIAGACALVAVRMRRHRRAAWRRAELTDAAPAVIDLLGACLQAGLNPYLALKRVAERSPEPLHADLARAAVDLELGRTPAAALRDAAERTGLDELRAAAGVLGAAERWGTPPAEALAARAESLRTQARRQAEAEAGRAAVRLAFPLVFCFLPAFALLIVLPTVAGALRAIAP